MGGSKPCDCRLRTVVRAVAVVFLLSLNLAFWGTLVFLCGMFRLVTRGAARQRVIVAAASLADRWVAGNDRVFDALLDVEWDVSGVDKLRGDARYLVIANHVSWIDVFAVTRVFRGRLPFPRIFLKRILILFPFAGLGCWALDFPFMRRYSPTYLAKHPEKRGRDLETTRIACRRYRGVPVSILNFVEGTRFTREKHEDQQSPWPHLLRPRVGGISFVVASLAGQLDGIVNVTLVYPSLDVTALEFARNRVPRVVVRARAVPIPDEFRDDAITEPGPVRDRFRIWIERLWSEKDAIVAAEMAAMGKQLKRIQNADGEFRIEN